MSVGVYCFKLVCIWELCILESSTSQWLTAKGYYVIVWRQSVIVPTGAVVVQD